jgi:hypothetical protein
VDEIIKPKSIGEEVLVKITNQMVFIRNETPILELDGDGRTFTTNYDYVADTLCVALNGLRQREGIDYDYEELGTNLFRFNHSLDSEDSVVVDYIKIMSTVG